MGVEKTYLLKNLSFWWQSLYQIYTPPAEILIESFHWNGGRAMLYNILDVIFYTNDDDLKLSLAPPNQNQKTKQ